ncbi:MAG: NnrU protein [Deltaproteobacteria bacterium]|nr:NnrU protein [Deltaproteobacteria bacterium]
MLMVALGLLIWSGVHLFPAAARPTRRRLVEKLGEKPYQGLFALSLLFAILLMVFGWRSILPTGLYGPPAWGLRAAEVGVFLALFSFAASAIPSNVQRMIRHPQLCGVAVWAGSHLLANGDQRSVLLFGGMLAWSVIEIVFINRRDGAWQKPGPLPDSAIAKPLIAAAVIYLGLFFAHPWIAGMAA